MSESVCRDQRLSGEMLILSIVCRLVGGQTVAKVKRFPYASIVETAILLVLLAVFVFAMGTQRTGDGKIVRRSQYGPLKPSDKSGKGLLAKVPEDLAWTIRRRSNAAFVIGSAVGLVASLSSSSEDDLEIFWLIVGSLFIGTLAGLLTGLVTYFLNETKK